MTFKGDLEAVGKSDSKRIGNFMQSKIYIFMTLRDIIVSLLKHGLDENLIDISKHNTFFFLLESQVNLKGFFSQSPSFLPHILILEHLVSLY